MPFKNTEHAKAYRKEYYQLNKDKILSAANKYWIDHREDGIKRCKERYKSNKSEYIQSAKEWAISYPEKRREIENKYQRTHKSISRLLRKRMREAIGSNKPIHTMELIGCTVSEVKKHLQETAIKNGYYDFNIESYDTKQYHIDHIVPCSAFNLEDVDQRLCFHWSNLQILDAKTNRLKSDSLIRM